MADKTPETLLDELLQMGTEREREAYLVRVCEGDDGLRHRLEDLLSENQQAEHFFQAAGLEARTQATEDETVEPALVEPRVEVGSVIDRYKILEKIGEGGMGDVYMAEQLEPVSRMVALKIIKLGMDTKQVVARFEAERQALAMMDHPCIARVLDGGATETGRPYFVMELVRGLSITEYCEKKKVGVKERLKLFTLVCEAVQSAHQKGVIHRDIKPSNILVTLNHGEPVPKVIDFGIAKAMNQRLTEKTLFTKFAQMIGTPAYMSPEQAEMTSLDVDTRTDVYSLGVLLYELLTGSAPFPQEKLMNVGYQEMQRIILEEEPDKPSTRITKTGKANRLDPRANQESSTDLRSPSLSEGDQKLAHSLRGDLDWITMKALEKDRRRRYGTPNELAADLERHLQDEPVTAAAPSLAYQLGKLYRRRRSLVRWVTAVALIVIVSAIVSGGLAIRLNLLRDEAVELRASEAEERANAERERDRAVSAEREVKLRSQELERQLYVSDMGAVERAIENEEWLAARDLMESHLPTEGRKDMRGFEWRYYWGQAQGEQISTLQAHDGEITDLEISSDGRWLATYGLDGRAKIWDLGDLSLIHEWDSLGKGSGTVSFSSGQQFLSIGTLFFDGRRRIQIKDLNSMEDAWVPDGRWGFASMSPVGSRLLTLRLEGQGMPIENHTVKTPDIQLWDYARQVPTPTWALLATYAVWSPSGKKLAFRVPASKASIIGANIEVWDVDSREQTHVFLEQRNVRSLSFSSDDRLLAVADGLSTRRVSVWDLESNTLRFDEDDHENRVTEVRFHPKKPAILASCSFDQTIRIWNCDEKKTVRRLTGQGSEITALAFTPDGQGLISGSKDGKVMLWRVEEGSNRDLLPNAYTVAEPNFSPSGRLVSINEWNGRLSPNRVDSFRIGFVTREEAGARSSESQEVEEEAERVMFETGFRLVMLNESTPMPKEGRDELVIGMTENGTLRFRGFHPTGLLVLEAEESDYSERVDDLRSLKEALSEFRDDPVFSDEQQIEFATRFSELSRDLPLVIYQDTIFETASSNRLWNVSRKERALAFTPDESSLLTLTTNQVFFRESMTGKLQKSVKFKEAIWNPNFRGRNSARWFDLSPDGNQIAVTELKPAIRIIDAHTGETTSVLDERILIVDVSFLASGDQVLFRGHGGISGLWNWVTQEKTLLQGEGAAKITWMAISPDSKTVAAVCKDNAIRVWRTRDGSLERTIRGLREALSKIVFAPDGLSVASLRAREARIVFWNTSTWRQVAALDRVASGHDVLGFSPNGKELYISGRGGTRIWRAPALDEIDLELKSNAIPDLESK